MILTMIEGVFYFLSPVLFFVCGMAEGLILRDEISPQTFKDSAIIVGITAILEIIYAVNAAVLLL